MKKNILIIALLIVMIISLIFNVIQFYNSKNKNSKIINSYKCTKNIESYEGSAPKAETYIINYDELGIVSTIKLIVKYKYDDEKIYEAGVNFYKQYGKNEYEFNEKDKEIIDISSIDYSNDTDENGNIMSNWVVNIINDYKNDGYNCSK